jgi:hypothetical protein
MAGNSFGRQVFDTIGRSIRLSADGSNQMKPGGITVDYDTITALAAAATYPDGIQVAAGEKVVEVGSIFCEITKGEVVTIDLSGDDDPTGGTFTVTVTGYGTTGDLAYNVSAADLQTALEGLVGAGNVTVTKSSFVYTATFDEDLANIGTITGDATDLTGGVGDTFAITVTPTTQGSAKGGYYGPYDTSATDGRQTPPCASRTPRPLTRPPSTAAASSARS